MPPSVSLNRNFRRFAARGERFARDTRGVTAIEFGLLAIPFFAILGATLETAIVFLASQIMDSAVQDSARLIRTGQAQSASYTAADYRSAICASLYSLFDCSKLKIRVRVVADFASAKTNTPVQTSGPNKGQWTVVETFTPGGRNAVVIVEAYYKWPVILNLGGFSLQNQPDGTRLLGSVRVFRNEPF